jgi:hypothetical protein
VGDRTYTRAQLIEIRDKAAAPSAPSIIPRLPPPQHPLPQARLRPLQRPPAAAAAPTAKRSPATAFLTGSI